MKLLREMEKKDLESRVVQEEFQKKSQPDEEAKMTAEQVPASGLEWLQEQKMISSIVAIAIGLLLFLFEWLLSS